MANTRGDLLAIVTPGVAGAKPIGKCFLAVGGTDLATWTIQALDKSSGDSIGSIPAGDFTGLKAVTAPVPANAPALGSFVSVAGYEVPNDAPSPQIAFNVIDYITTADGGATVFALLARSDDPTTRIAVPVADIGLARN